jgi:hypothetical protein
VQFRGESHFGVDHPVGGQVLRTLGGDPGQCLPGLHHRDRVPERVQVELQVTAVRAAAQPLGDLADVLRGQFVVANLPGQFHHGGRPEATVQVVVQQHLGNAPDLLETRSHLPIFTVSLSKDASSK